MTRILRREKLRLFGYCVAIAAPMWFLPLILDLYADTTFPYIAASDIPGELVSYVDPVEGRMCPVAAGKDSMQIPFIDTSDSWRAHLQPGGVWEPQDCQGRYKITMVIPYRDRPEHRQLFLNYMHRFLQAQHTIYRIVLVEQAAGKPFNRGALFNCAVDHVIAHWPENHCLILHDVDLIPLDLRNIYACSKLPRHLVTTLDAFRFHLPYRQIIGGAVAISATDFQTIDGFSNNFWGWGGEDDDLALRLAAHNVTFVRFDPRVATYTMLPHSKAQPSDNRWDVLAKFGSNIVNGLSTVRCNCTGVTLHPTCTHLVVDL